MLNKMLNNKRVRSRKLQLKWTVNDTYLLIDAVKNTPLLWASTNWQHSRRRYLWALISQNVYQSRILPDELKQKWHNLRCQFFVSVYKVKNNLITKVKWMYFPKLSFLLGKRQTAELSPENGQLCSGPIETIHIEDESNASNLSAIPSNTNDSTTTNLPFEDLTISNVTSLALNISTVSTQTDEMSHLFNCNNQVLSEAFKLIPTRPCDGSQIFGDYVALQMRRISTDKRLALEVKIQKLIMENS